MRNRGQNVQDWADIIDFLTMYPEPRCTVIRSADSRRQPEGSFAAVAVVVPVQVVGVVTGDFYEPRVLRAVPGSA